MIKVSKDTHPNLYHIMTNEDSIVGYDQTQQGKVDGEDAYMVKQLHKGELAGFETQLKKMSDKEQTDWIKNRNIPALIEKYHLDDFCNWMGDWLEGFVFTEGCPHVDD